MSASTLVYTHTHTHTPDGRPLRLIDLLDNLEQQGLLQQLYRAGVVTLAVYSQREVYHTYRTLLSSLRYQGQPGQAAQATAEGCQVAVRTVYRALKAMEQEVGEASPLAA